METKQPTILAIDDIQDNLTSLKAVLHDALPEFKLLTALDGKSGIALAQAEDPDVILLDIVMPGMDGFAVCRKLKADAELSQTPVVFLTALKTDQESRVRALEVGAEGFLAKPLDESELIAQIRAMVKIKAANRRQRMEKEELSALVAERTRELEKELAERKRAEADLEESEERFELAMNASNDGLFDWDLKTNAIYYSPGWKKMIGYEDHELPNDFSVWEKTTAPEDVKKSWELQQKLISKQIDRFVLEFKMTHKDGHWVDILSRAKAIFDYKGKAIRIVGTHTDISERKQAEKRLKQSTDELSRLYRASGALLTSASPNLENLAQAIVKAVLVEFEHTNCSLILVQPNSDLLDRVAVTGPYADEVAQSELRLSGPGLVPDVIQTGGIINLPDVTTNPSYVSNWKSAHSEIAVPLKVGERVIGVIDLQSEEPDAFSEQDERLISSFAARAALAIENARLFSSSKHRLKRLVSLREIDKAIIGSFDLRISLNVLLEHLRSHLNVDAAAVLTYQKNIQTLTFSHSQGFRTAALQHTNLRLGKGYAGKVALERSKIAIPDLKQDESGFLESPYLKNEGFRVYYGLPLIAKGELVGVLEIFHRSALKLDDEMEDFLSALTGQAAIAIDNINLFSDLQRSNMDLELAYHATIEGWAKALEMRDMETEGHSRRVVNLTMEIAQRMGLSSSEQVHIRRGALLHDIGKMGVPDNILQKPGKLTEEEWVIMRLHPVFAYNWLSPIQYLRPALDIPYSHHERWDGAGYPRGLKGERIPLAARIFAIVDVFDALSSDRPYRKAWSEEKALEYIQEQSGKHFDPQVVDVFLPMVARQSK